MCPALRTFFFILVPAALLTLQARSADFDIEEAETLFLSGNYKEALAQAGGAIEEGERGERWRLLHANCLWMTGRYPEAKLAIEAARRLYYYSIKVRLLAHKIYKSAGDEEKARDILDEINMLAGSRRMRYSDASDVVALGEAAVLLGADPRLVLDNFLTPAKKADPDLRAAPLAIGRLALSKHDYALAGKAFQEGLQKFKDDPDLLAGLAEAFAPDDRKAMLAALEKTFEGNPNHIEARILLADHLVDAEEYDTALEELAKIAEANPNYPPMWAYRAVIEHLRNNIEEESNARNAGLRYWAENPEVDHIIGRKLSQKYRFMEGSSYQRQALKYDPEYLPAKIQLAQDLLRLGVEHEGWKLAEDVFKSDAYDVSAYNLVTLQDTLKKFTTLTNEHFAVRMSEHEAAIYGSRVLALLEKAREQLTRKYGLELTNRVTVEIFPQQKDFAVRTFGMPGGEGYLGVCFGNVITANSPVSQEMNWQSVLWHEFCHVVTLNITRNKMPRWLSEGISVYEERRADPRWGEQISPRYREMILEGEMKPISDLSSAFMAPKSGLHLQFAYYQSSLVVEFLIERFGTEALRNILRDLGEGNEINETLARHTEMMSKLEKDFEDFAKGTARELGPDTRWAKPKRNDRGEVDTVWAGLHRENVWILAEQAAELLEEQKWAEAIEPLEKWIELFPLQQGADCAYAQLALVHRKLNQTDQEREALARWAQVDPEATDGLLRLIEIDLARNDASALRSHAERLLEVNPVTPQAYRAIGKAAENSGAGEEAIASYRILLKLQPPNPAAVHYDLARLLHQAGNAEAKRHILLALQDAPRFREGHRLLLDILGEKPQNVD